MPPKKRSAQRGVKRGRKNGAEDKRSDREDGAESSVQDTEPPAKVHKASHASVLEWLLSPEAFDLANPEIPAGKGEVDLPPGGTAKTAPPDDAGKQSSPATDKLALLRYPQSHLTPFQNLVSACILSKPLSHKLGLRTIQTLLNPPFSIRTVKDLDEAGYEGRRKVMWEARTQHKEKTAAQLGDLITGLRELSGSDEGLDGLVPVREALKGCKSSEEAQKRVLNQLTTVKGIGPGVVAIFLRRIQADWQEVFPYVDDRSLSAAVEFGLVKDGEGAQALSTAIGGEGAEGRRRYVKIVDTLVGIDLEKKTDEAKKMAGIT